MAADRYAVADRYAAADRSVVVGNVMVPNGVRAATPTVGDQSVEADRSVQADRRVVTPSGVRVEPPDAEILAATLDAEVQRAEQARTSVSLNEVRVETRCEALS